MIKSRILHMMILAIFLAAGFSARAPATSIVAGYPVDHYEGTNWVITQINGHLIAADNAPTIEIMNGNVFVNQGCPSFMMAYPDENRPNYTEVSFVATFAPCDEMTPQQKAVSGIFQSFEQFSPKGKDSIFVFAHDNKWLVAVRQK